MKYVQQNNKRSFVEFLMIIKNKYKIKNVS